MYVFEKGAYGEAPSKIHISLLLGANVKTNDILWRDWKMLQDDD